MITIDELRKLGGIPQPEGTGVIKYRVGNRAWHFYDGRIHQVKNTGIHEHFNDFTSQVLKGELKNYIYAVDSADSNSTLQLIYKQSKLNAEYVVKQNNIKLIEMCTFSTVVGESYYLQRTALHKIEMLAPKVVTFLTGDQWQENQSLRYVVDTAIPQPARSKNKPLPLSERWEIIEDILND